MKETSNTPANKTSTPTTTKKNTQRLTQTSKLQRKRSNPAHRWAFAVSIEHDHSAYVGQVHT